MTVKDFKDCFVSLAMCASVIFFCSFCTAISFKIIEWGTSKICAMKLFDKNKGAAPSYVKMISPNGQIFAVRFDKVYEKMKEGYKLIK